MVTTIVRITLKCDKPGCGVTSVIEREFDADSGDTLNDLNTSATEEAEDEDWTIDFETAGCRCPLHQLVDEEDYERDGDLASDA